ncbi:hypothetical protein HK096_000038, partial [Nowakowskiella sp. JEL0078]
MPIEPSIQVASINVDGLVSSFNQITEILIKFKLHFIACQETWLKPQQRISRIDHLIVADLRLPAEENTGHRHTG